MAQPLADSRRGGLDAAVMGAVDREMHRRVDADEFTGAISYVFRHGVVAHFDAYKMKSDTIVRIFSLTKSIVTVAIAILNEQQRLTYDDEVSKYIPAFANTSVWRASSRKWESCKRPITLRHLLTHTSGLGYGGDHGKGEPRYQHLVDRLSSMKSLEHFCDELAKVALLFQPGERWEYGYSYDVLGRVIEVASNESLDTFLKRHIFDELSMHDTGFRILEKDRHRLSESWYTRKRRKGHRDQDSDDWIFGNEHVILSGGGTLDGRTGGLLSTCNDLSRFFKMLFNQGQVDGQAFLFPSTVQELCREQLQEVTGRSDSWCYDTPSLGFSFLGAVSVQHANLENDMRVSDYGWGSIGGIIYVIDEKTNYFLICIALNADDAFHVERILRKGIHEAIRKGRVAVEDTSQSADAVKDTSTEPRKENLLKETIGEARVDCVQKETADAVEATTEASVDCVRESEENKDAVVDTIGETSVDRNREHVQRESKSPASESYLSSGNSEQTSIVRVGDTPSTDCFSVKLLQVGSSLLDGVRGWFQSCGDYAGRPVYKKKMATPASNICIYYWDARFGSVRRGWRIGPLLLGRWLNSSEVLTNLESHSELLALLGQAWAMHESDGAHPPTAGWVLQPGRRIDRTLHVWPLELPDTPWSRMPDVLQVSGTGCVGCVVGFYVKCKERHCNLPLFRRKSAMQHSANIYLFYWGEDNGLEWRGWWLGRLDKNIAWAWNDQPSIFPPVDGWRNFDSNGQHSESNICVIPTNLQQ